MAGGKEYLLKGVDPFDEKASIQSLFGTDLKGRVLQEAIWNVYQARRYICMCVGCVKSIKNENLFTSVSDTCEC